MGQFQWNASEYEKYSTGQKKWAKELLAKLRLEKGMSVLDIGCGDGSITAGIAEKVPDGLIVGVDSSDSMIMLAADRYPSSVYKNLTFEVMDAKNLTFFNKFDLVFSNAALHWVDDHSQVFKGINKSLKPGGRILIQTGGKGNAKAAFEILDEMTTIPEWQPYLAGIKFPYYFPTAENYQDMVPAAGFQPMRIEMLHKDMVHQGLEGFMGFIRTTWLPYTLSIPENKREQFIYEAAKLYVQHYPPDEEGKIHIRMVRLEVEAIKSN
jgi:trans-aconitate methyltransferase